MTAARRASGLTERLASATATLKQVPEARPRTVSYATRNLHRGPLTQSSGPTCR